MTRSGVTMRLLGGFELRRDGQVIDVPFAAHRLLGFLALKDRHVPRAYVADSLWPDTSEDKAGANLRTALWRLRRIGRGVFVQSTGQVGLDPSLSVDVRALHQAARDYRRHGVLPDPELLLDFRGELLPACWDSWLVFERERLRQEAVELLEASSRAALADGAVHLALLLGLGAVECDPLRESANVLAVRIRMIEGDLVGAIRHARTYARTLHDEIGIAPPEPLADLLASYPPTGSAGSLVPQWQLAETEMSV